MYWLIVVYVGITALNQNGMMTTPAVTNTTAFSSQATCDAAKTAVTAHAAGNFRVFADCIAQ